MPTPIKLYENGRMQVNGEIIEFPPELKGGRNLLSNSDFSKQLTGWTIQRTPVTASNGLVTMGPGSSIYQRSVMNIGYTSNHVVQLLVRGTGTVDVHEGGIGGTVKGIPSATDFTWVSFPLSGTGNSNLVIDVLDGQIELSKVKLEKGNIPTPWSLTPEELGLNIPSWVENFSNASFNEKGVLSGGLVEVPSELYSNPNLLLQSNVYISSGGAYLVNIYDMIEEWLLNTTYTVTIKGKLNDGQRFGIWANGAATNVGYTDPIGNDIHVAKVRASSITTNGDPKTLRVYNYPGTSATSAEIEWIKLEKGDVSTAYSKALVEYDGTSNEGTNNSIVIGRNLVQKSDSFNLGSTEASSGITRSITPEGYLKVVTVAGNKNWLSSWYKSVANIEESLSEGDIFTVSITIKSDDSTSKPTLYLKTGIGYFSFTGDIGPEFSTIYYTGVWKDVNTLVPHLGWSGTAGTYYIKNWKMEKGDVPTPWTPAPEDLGLSIPSWVTTFGNPISMSSEGISVSDELSEYPNVITDGLELWYDFKEMYNDSRNKETAFDLSGKGRDGILTNFKYDASSGYDNGLLFNGVDNRIITNYTPPIVATFEITLKATTMYKHGHILSTYNDDTIGALLQISSGGLLQTYIGNRSTFVPGESIGELVTITISFDGAVAKFYRDGNLWESDDAIMNTIGPLILGDRNNLTRAYQGYIYSTRVYNRALTDEQVKYNYEVEKGRWN